tara:strand:- start:46468 stop:47433 length:966 start_codon:yes stop_codon:yes gene_type:complete
MEYKRLSFKHKNNKFKYYVLNYLRQLLPSSYYQKKLTKKISNSLDYDKIEKRVNYYNKLILKVDLNNSAIKLSDIKREKGKKTYFFDLYEYGRFFQQNLRGHFLFGDIIKIPKEPSLVKSRPINGNNSNSTILKWNKVRHFIFIKNESKEFSEKKNLLVSRGKVHRSQPQRVKFLEKYFDNPLCNIGKVNDNDLNPKWNVNRMTINEQLEYKFILCIEGNDVASNLKWVMSSNSIAVMPKPKYETWFMEGLLIPDYHYIVINDNYTDLKSKLAYYIENPEKAKEIVKNAHIHVEQFKDEQTEDIISLMVLKKYFEKTNQVI